MKAFTVYESYGVAIMKDNIDTDILIPKQFLKTVSISGFSDKVFAPWRYDENGKEIKDFPLNQEKYKNAGILITGDNFGCGSSREHAAWALQDYGFRVVIAGGYSDIFFNNWINNGNLPITLDKKSRDFLASLDVDDRIRVDLPNLKIKAGGREFEFDFSPESQKRLIEGKDAIAMTLEYEDAILAYEEIND